MEKTTVEKRHQQILGNVESMEKSAEKSRVANAHGGDAREVSSKCIDI